jgi:hypothetical protein
MRKTISTEEKAKRIEGCPEFLGALHNFGDLASPLCTRTKLVSENTVKRIALVLLMLATASFAQQKPQPGPTLDATLAFMQNALAQYGYIHTSGKDQELKIKKYNDEPCRLFVEWETKYEMNTLEDGVYPIEYRFDLGSIDPESVKVSIPDYEKHKPEGWKLINVHLAATNNESSIYMSASNWDTKDSKVPETLRLTRQTDFSFQFRDKEQAERFAKALKHAVVLCGGKPSSF